MSYNKKISVQLDKMATDALEEIMAINKCTISDAVNAALLAFSKDKQPCMLIEEKPIDVVYAAMAKQGVDINEWCDTRNINILTLKYLVKRCANGGTVWGFGNNKNKWRDKQDGRVFKTHTAWIAHCLKEDFGIDLT